MARVENSWPSNSRARARTKRDLHISGRLPAAPPRGVDGAPMYNIYERICQYARAHVGVVAREEGGGHVARAKAPSHVAVGGSDSSHFDEGLNSRPLSRAPASGTARSR